MPNTSEESRAVATYVQTLLNRESLLAIVIVSTRFRSTLSTKFVRVGFKARAKQLESIGPRRVS